MVQCKSLDVKTPHGLVTYNYVISTPTEPSATAIDPSLPTLLFLHPVYIAVSIYHPQFCDPNIRRFNLVALDLLSHGYTQGKVPAIYGQKEAAADVAAFMDTLKLPPCIVVGLSMGTIIGLQLAVSFPKKVSALFLVSPLGTPEPEDVAEGRRQIHDTWREAFVDGEIDQETINDSLFGALQLGFNSRPSSFVTALTKATLPRALAQWGPENFDAFETVTVKFFTERKGYDQATLSKFAASDLPVALIHCLADVAYPPEYDDLFACQLLEAGVKAQVHNIENAPHFGNASHPAIVNPILHRFVLDAWKGGEVPKAQSSVTSPFEARLRETGWHGSLSSDDDDDSDDD